MELTRLESAADAIIAAATDRDGALREIAQLLEARVEHYDWVGFYLAEGRELVLGPFVGTPTEHVRIPFGCGVCGSYRQELWRGCRQDACRPGDRVDLITARTSIRKAPPRAGFFVRGRADQ